MFSCFCFEAISQWLSAQFIHTNIILKNRKHKEKRKRFGESPKLGGERAFAFV